jgi:hypothetical protein
MAEPDNIVLEHLRAIRADLADVKQQLQSKAEAAQVADMDSKLSGSTHVVISSLGSVVQSLESLDRRVARLEHEPSERWPEAAS